MRKAQDEGSEIARLGLALFISRLTYLLLFPCRRVSFLQVDLLAYWMVKDGPALMSNFL